MAGRVSNPDEFDVLIVGCGTAGMVATIFAADAGLRVLVVEASPRPGGTLQVASGQMSAAGTRLQRERGISDSAARHFADVMRISRHTANPELVRIAVDNAADTFDWLMEHGFEPLDDHPVLGAAHEPYSEARYYWGAEFGFSVLKVLDTEFARVSALPNVETRFNSRVTELHGGQDGAPVTGVTYIGADERRQSARAASVVLATGGYNGDPHEFTRRSGRQLLAASANAYSRGDGHNLAESVGGQVVGAEKFLCSFGSVLESFEFPAKLLYRAESRPEVRPPWEITVNLHGERFVAEDNPSVDAREHALVVQPEMQRFIVFDQGIKDEAPSMFSGVEASEIDLRFGTHPMFLRADSLTDLASQMGVPAENLERTVAEYNADGPDVWGRSFKPRKIETGPYFAVVVHGLSVTSTAGVDIDSEFRVRIDGRLSAPNLYAVGEVIGAGQTMGNSFCGGMMATPAMTFGRLLAEQLALNAAKPEQAR